MPAWISEHKDNVEKDLDLDSIIEFASVKDMEIDFLMKL